MRQTKLDILKKINFGKRVAEDERTELAAYFVETEQWRRLLEDDIDIVVGAKGTGKSALFCLLFEHSREDRHDILCVAADNVKGATVFKSLDGETVPSVETIIYLWKLYIIALLVNELDKKGLHTAETSALRDALGKAGILPKRFSIQNVFHLIKDFAFRVIEGEPSSVEYTLTIDSSSGLPTAISRKSSYEKKDRRSDLILWVNEYLMIVNDALERSGKKAWIAFDRLDVAFSESLELERNAIRALFNTYNDMKSFEQIRMKIFVRDDIWRRISGDSRFSEASHIIKESDIRWDDNGLLNLVFKRVVKNKGILAYLGTSDDVLEMSIEHQKELLYKILPDKIESGKNPYTIDWIISRLKDGLDVSAPREIIHILECAKEIQIKRLERNEVEPLGTILFERSVFKEAIGVVSKTKYEKTLCAEYPHLVSYMEKLRGGKTEYTVEPLSAIWGIDVESAKYKAEELAGIGFFGKIKNKQDKSSFSYKIPMLYRSALDSVRGSAKSPSTAENINAKTDKSGSRGESYSSLIFKALMHLRDSGINSANGAEITRTINNNLLSRDKKKKEATNVSRALRSSPVINEPWLKIIKNDDGVVFSLSETYTDTTK
ncbi:P-loop ATPase, Sll1717 family [Aeromonas allosaccharophila]|uniref:P-loop ATPase, Sll1717 family n=1 Tax=Aeromonas allosaccharophila TaxID=656 RepID=UPI0011177F57|nr:hypothetical protein [Aeromonas allosaccharophila]TNI94686.1 hypothetical protein CF120_02035 [Aeromonas allosaccharophila]